MNLLDNLPDNLLNNIKGDLIKKIRSNDNVIVSLYSTGKKKYTIINDSDIEVKNSKVSSAYEDNTLILEDLSKYAIKNRKDPNYYKIIQDPYIDLIKREYGNGVKSPYFLNNGCKLCIEWVGDVPNPDFSIGTYSKIEDIPSNVSKRWINGETITCDKDEATNPELLPKSTWKDINDKRDVAIVKDKIVNLYVPDGINNKNVYFIWTENGLDYTTTDKEEKYFISSTTDANIIKTVIDDYKRKVLTLHGIKDYELELCSPNTKSCFLIEYKSPLKEPIESIIEDENKDDKNIPKGPRLIVEGFADVIKVKINTNLDPFVVWAGEPTPLNEFDYGELSDEYIETGFMGKEETEIKYELQAYDMEMESPKDSDFIGEGVDTSFYKSGNSSVVVSTSGTSNAKFKNKHLSNIKKGYDPLGQYKLKDVKAGLTFFAQNVNKWYLFDEIPSWLKGIDLINPLKATKNMYQYASHRGVDYNSDISLLNKQVVKCVYDGVVQSFHFDPNGGGYLVLVKHTYKGNVFHTYYMHLSNKRLVGNGEVVKKGDVIGRVGNTGAAEGLHSTHLHFEIRGANLQTFYDPVAVYGPDKINRV